MKKIAIVGYGGQGAWHANWASRSEVISLAGVYDTKEARMEAAREAGIHTYASVAELMADPAVDIVLCATPNDSHKEIVIAAAEAKKHIVCEKPVALSVSDFDDMVKAAADNGVCFTVHQNRRWDVDFLAMKGLIQSGDIGDTLNVESRIHGSRGIPSDWRGQKEHGGGMILDWGVHLIDQMMQLVPDRVTSVYCEETNITNDEVDDGFHLRLGFEGGKRAAIEVGTFNFIAMPRFYMQCKNGSAMITDWREKCRVSRLKTWVGKDAKPVQTAAGITKTMAPRDAQSVDEYQLEIPISDVHDFYRNFVAAIDGKAEQAIRNDEVRRVLMVMEAAHRSWETKSVLQVNI